jgi:hypothetical protein
VAAHLVALGDGDGDGDGGSGMTATGTGTKCVRLCVGGVPWGRKRPEGLWYRLLLGTGTKGHL